MIVDLRVGGRRAVIVGGGREAERRMAQLVGEGCSVAAFSEGFTAGMRAMARGGRAELVRGRVSGAGFLARRRPFLVVAATGDGGLNARLVAAARRLPGCLAYASDDASAGDFAHLAPIRLRGGVRAAVSTGGRSPAVARRLRARAGRALSGLVTPEDVGHMAVQDAARRAARRAIPDAAGRRRYLRAVMSDARVSAAVRARRTAAAVRRAEAMLEGRR